MISDDQANWLLAEGESGGNRIMVRARDPDEVIIDPTRKYVVITSLGYTVQNADRLPSDDDYERIGVFEEEVFETRSGDPELVFIETGSGFIRYFAYTSDVARTVASISANAAPFEILDWDSAEDPEWQIYLRRIGRLRS